MRQVFFTVLGLFALFGTSLAFERHVYRQMEGEKTFDFVWERVTADPATIQIQGGGEISRCICDPDGATLQFTLQNSLLKIQAVFQQNGIHLTGYRAGQPVEAQFNPGGLPWYQCLSYSLTRFLSSPRKTILFQILRLDTLSLMKLRARKAGVENVRLERKTVPAMKIELGLTGVLSGLWHAHYWFRMPDQVFIQYKGVHGPPGTPGMRVYLLP